MSTILEIGLFSCLFCSMFLLHFFVWEFSSSSSFLLFFVLPFTMFLFFHCCYPEIHYRRMGCFFFLLSLYSILLGGTKIITTFALFLLIFLASHFYLDWSGGGSGEQTIPTLPFLKSCAILWTLSMLVLLFYLFSYYSILNNTRRNASSSSPTSFVMDPYLLSLGEKYLSAEPQFFENTPDEAETYLLNSIQYFSANPFLAPPAQENFQGAAGGGDGGGGSGGGGNGGLEVALKKYIHFFRMWFQILDFAKKHLWEMVNITLLTIKSPLFFSGQ